MSQGKVGFFIAPFALDGELVGIGFRALEELSAKWVTTCAGFLRANGEVFRASWGGPLQRFETSLTSSEGAAIGAFYVAGEVAISTLYLRDDRAVGEEVLGFFLESMRRVEAVQQAAATRTPFEALRTIRQRPLNVVVGWPNPRVSDDDQETLRELSLHFAAAFLVPPPGG